MVLERWTAPLTHSHTPTLHSLTLTHPGSTHSLSHTQAPLTHSHTPRLHSLTLTHPGGGAGSRGGPHRSAARLRPRGDCTLKPHCKSVLRFGGLVETLLKTRVELKVTFAPVLPRVHMLWDYLLHALRSPHPAVIFGALEALAAVVETAGGDFLSSRWVTLRASWVTLRGCWVTLRARWVRLRARWVTLRAHWVTLRARWVTLRARWVTLRARWVTLRARWMRLRARWVTLRARWATLRARWVTLRARWVSLRAHWMTFRARWVSLRARWVTLGSRRTACPSCCGCSSTDPLLPPPPPLCEAARRCGAPPRPALSSFTSSLAPVSTARSVGV
jgi:hypothetical protein